MWLPPASAIWEMVFGLWFGFFGCSSRLMPRLVWMSPVVWSCSVCPELGLALSLVGVQRLDYICSFFVSDGWVRASSFRCPEVVLEFPFLGVQRLN